jgi:hypothetical protein
MCQIGKKNDITVTFLKMELNTLILLLLLLLLFYF